MRPIADVPHELTFVSDIAGLVSQILTDRPELPFSHATVEVSARGKLTRRDFTVYDKQGKPALTGEVKLPYRPDGRSPYHQAVVNDAAQKAVDAGVRYFFTWNINTFVLWDLQQAGKPLMHRDQEKHDVAEVISVEDLQDPDLSKRLAAFWGMFLERFCELLAGQKPLATRSLDERFIDILDTALKSPWMVIRFALTQRYQTDQPFRGRMNRWMSRHGMRIAASEVSANIQRTTQVAAYVVASRLMFYKALHRRFRDVLRPLSVPSSVTTAGKLRSRLDRYFREAERVTGDYETIFRGDDLDEVPFLTDDVVPAWRGLLEDIEGFDFTELDYDLIGPIFERLIAPRERHRWGQHYTKPEVCDIINAFCIRSEDDKVLDPACGGGTFLVRAYARKLFLAREWCRSRSHQELLSEINGVDISVYAAHISTVNLASRSLEDEANYPRVAVNDFFDVTPGKAAIHLPTGEVSDKPAAAAANGNLVLPNTPIGRVNAVVGNPPYIRQEELEPSYKRKLTARASSSPLPLLDPAGRSDIHIYFWPHAASFLENGGRIGLLTSSNWLDTEYGVPLQAWMTSNFRIIAILESAVEPWFTGARVSTAVTILEREPDPAARDANTVRFVRFIQPLTTVFDDCESDEGKLARMHKFVRAVSRSQGDMKTETFLLRSVPQSQLAATLTAHTDPQARETHSAAGLLGSKWGVYLRSPDLLFDLLDRFAEHLVPLGGVAEVRRGITSGADEFFFVRDVTDEWLEDRPGAIKETFGIKPSDTDSIRLIAVGDGTVHPIEARFLVPEVHRLAEVTRIEVRPEDMPRRMVAISRPLAELSGTHAAAYIRWGQRKPRQYHKRSTCAARTPWYDITGFQTPTILWSMSHKYRHLAPFNPHRVVPNHNLFGVDAGDGVDDELLCAVLNSTIVGWVKCFISRPMGTEGFKTEVVDARRMPIPDPRLADEDTKAAILAAFHKIRERQTLNLIHELDLDDRRELDDAVFRLLGVDSARERGILREKLHEATRVFYSSLRHVERQATRNRTRTARRSKVTPYDIAMEIWDGLDKSALRRFPQGFMREPTADMEPVQVPSRATHLAVGTGLFTLEAAEGMSKPGKKGEALAAGCIRINDEVFDLGSLERAQYLEAMILAGHTGLVRVPVDAPVCAAAVSDFRRYRDDLREKIEEWSAEHAGAGRLADQVAATLEAICLRGYGWPSWADASLVQEETAEYELDEEVC